MSPSQKQRQNWSKQCDTLFAKLVRESGPCVTRDIRQCKGVMQCSHIFTRGLKPIAWDFRNAVPQCAGCHFWFTHHPEHWDDWRRNYLGEDLYVELRTLGMSGVRVDRKARLAELKEIERLARPGAVVLDPFMGSGTTLRAAKDLQHDAAIRKALEYETQSATHHMHRAGFDGEEIKALREEVERLKAELVQATLTQLDAIYPPELLERAEIAEAEVAGMKKARGYLGARVAVLTEALGELVDACDEYENSGYSGGFHEAKTAARALLSHPEQNPAECPHWSVDICKRAFRGEDCLCASCPSCSPQEEQGERV